MSKAAISASQLLDVSVVMGVYNAAASLEATVESVLSQTGVNLEFIIVDDGSTDETPSVLAETASLDSRLRVLHQKNAGLTCALIEGCKQARAPIIARQDAGDRSLPGRFAALVSAMTACPDAVMATCGTRYVSPRGHVLRVVVQQPGELHHSLATTDPLLVCGPSHHGATAFRRDVYEQVGGYRAEFAVAQDLDLWMRLREQGRCLSLPDIGYEAELAPGSISFSRKSEQEAARQAILRASAARRSGGSDREIVSEHAAGNRALSGQQLESKYKYSAYCYFLSGLLAAHDKAAALKYMRTALAQRPFNVRYIYRFIRISISYVIFPLSKKESGSE